MIEFLSSEKSLRGIYFNKKTFDIRAYTLL